MLMHSVPFTKLDLQPMSQPAMISLFPLDAASILTAQQPSLSHMSVPDVGLYTR
jgi:hypothetical protein